MGPEDVEEDIEEEMKLEPGTPIFAVCEFDDSCGNKVIVDSHGADTLVCPGKFFFNREEEGLHVGQRLKYRANSCPHFSDGGVWVIITHVDDAFIKFVHRFNDLWDRRRHGR